MLDNYEKDIKLLVTWYVRAKEVTITAESLDTINGTFIQPLHEQRYCLDHLIRAVLYEKEGKPEELVKKAISSAISHLQRAYSDSVEWMLVSVVDEFSNILAPYTSEQISKGFSKYYSEIRPNIDKITGIVNQYKIVKSAERATNTEETGIAESAEQFVDEKVVQDLQRYLEELHNSQGALIDIKSRDDEQKKKVIIKDKIMFPIVTGVIGTIVGTLFMLLFT